MIAVMGTVAVGFLTVACLTYLWMYYRCFDHGWLHCHFGGRRRAWEVGEPWRGNGLTAEELSTLGVSDRVPADPHE